MAAKQTLIDQETLDYLTVQREDDYRIVREVGIERQNIEFKYGHAERFNNWKTDELYIERTISAEEAFLEKIQDEEMQALLARHVSYSYKRFFFLIISSLPTFRNVKPNSSNSF